MKRCGLALAAVGFFALLGLAACNSGGGSGGVEEEGGGSAITISGPSKVAAGSKATFTVSGGTATITAYRWIIAGDGTMVGAKNKSAIVVQADANTNGGRYKLVLRVMINGVWLTKAKRQVVVKASGTPRFRVVLNGASFLTPTTFTSSGQLLMTADTAQATTWAVYFDGDTSGLPAQVPVTVTTTSDAGTLANTWLTVENQTLTLSFPRSGGGTVGNGGSVLNVGSNRPLCQGFAASTSAKVTFSAAGVETMVISVTR